MSQAKPRHQLHLTTAYTSRGTNGQAFTKRIWIVLRKHQVYFGGHPFPYLPTEIICGGSRYWSAWRGRDSRFASEPA